MARQRSYYVRDDLLFDLREDAHLTQAALAQKVGVSEVTIRNWERGLGIHWSNAVKLGRILKIDPEKLITRTPPAVAGDERAAAEQVAAQELSGGEDTGEHGAGAG